MSSRLTIDSTTLKVRDVFCLNPINSDYIQPASIPVIGDSGKITWLSSIEFLSSISVPTLSTTLLDLLGSIQPGFCTFSTIVYSTFPCQITSTVAGLGESGYVSSAQLRNNLNTLSLDHSYISATTLYDSFVNMANMKKITDNLGPMAIHLGGQLSNLSRGYVSTINPGQYKIYKSSMGLEGTNINVNLPSGTNVPSALINLAGFKQNIVNTSHMRIDVNANIQLNSLNGPTPTTFSTFLLNPVTSRIVGDPIRMTFDSQTATMANLTFFLNANDLRANDLYYFPTSLRIQHRMSNTGGLMNVRTYIPDIGGIFVTLDNTD